MEILGPSKEWFAHVTGRGLVSEFEDVNSACQAAAKTKGIVLDVKRNKIVKKTDSTELTEMCTRRATEMGYFIQSNKETAGLMDLVHLFRRYFDVRSDLLLFLITVFALALSNYLNAYSDVLAGKVYFIYLYKSILI